MVEECIDYVSMQTTSCVKFKFRALSTDNMRGALAAI